MEIKNGINNTEIGKNLKDYINSNPLPKIYLRGIKYPTKLKVSKDNMKVANNPSWTSFHVNKIYLKGIEKKPAKLKSSPTNRVLNNPSWRPVKTKAVV